MTLIESQAVYNLASASLESNRIPDPYPYGLSYQGKLISLNTGEIVERIVETRTYLGKAELAGLLKLQELVRQHDSGTIVWISPPFSGEYEAAKIIASEIIRENGTKIIFNRAIVLDDLSATDCFLYARDLNQSFPESIESLRKNPIFIGSDISWLEVLATYLDITEIRAIIASGQDKIIKQEAVKKAMILQGQLGFKDSFSWSQIKQAITSNSQFGGFLGNKGWRCQARTAFEVVFESAHQINWREGICRLCNKHCKVGPCSVCKECEDRDNRKNSAFTASGQK